MHRKAAKLGILACFVKAFGPCPFRSSVLNEMLRQPQSLRLVVRSRTGGAVKAVGHGRHRFIDETADRLAFLDQERHVMRAHLENSACVAGAELAHAEARIEKPA